jgi:hypothetical protein
MTEMAFDIMKTKRQSIFSRLWKCTLFLQWRSWLVVPFLTISASDGAHLGHSNKHRGVIILTHNSQVNTFCNIVHMWHHIDKRCTTSSHRNMCLNSVMHIHKIPNIWRIMYNIYHTYSV